MRHLCIFALLVFAVGCSKSPRHYTDAGNRFFQAHKYDDASINFRKAIQKDPNFGDAYYGLGQVFLAQGKAREAYAVLNRVAELEPQNLDAKKKLANLALAGYLGDRRRPKNLYDQLNKLAAEFLARDPNSYDGLRLKAYIALNDNSRAQSIDYFKKALQVKPGDPEMTIVLAQNLFEQSETAAQGEKLLLDLISKHKDSGPAWDTLYRYYSLVKRPGEAEDVLKRKVAANPTDAGYVMQLAAHYWRNHKSEEMNATINKLVNDPKTFPKGLLQAGDFYAQIDDRERGLKYYRQGAQTSTDDKLTYQKREVAELNAMGHSDEALSLVEEVLREHAKDSEMHLTRALILLGQNKIDPALAELQQLDQNQRNNAVVKYHLGRALMLKGKSSEATAAWEESTKLQPNLVEPLVALASYAVDNRHYDQAQKWVDRAIEVSPTNLQAQIIRSEVLQGLGRQSEAKSLLSSLREQFPNNRVVDLEFAVLTLRENKPAEAEKIFQAHYTPGQADQRVLVGLVESLVRQKRNDEAVRVLRTDLAKAPGRTSVQMMLANLLVSTGQPDAAVHTLEELATSHPDLAVARMRLGQIKASQGNLDSALEDLRKAQQLAPKATDVLLAIAEVEERLGRMDPARQDYQAVLKVDASNLVALNNLAFITAESGGNLDDALRMATTASQKLPKQPDVSDTLGYVYLKQKKVSSALEVFGNLTQQYPANPTFRFHHALALLESGSKEQARKELETALANKPSPDLASKIRQALGRAS